MGVHVHSPVQPDARVDTEAWEQGVNQRARPQVHGVLVTYRRPHMVPVMFQRLAEQQRPLDTLVVVDNDPDESARAAVEAAQASETLPVTYLPTGANVGPAGGIALGMRHVLDHSADHDWVLPLDDDDPPGSPDVVARLLQLGEELCAEDPAVGAIGLCGARFSTSRARSVRVPDAELHDVVDCDWIGSGNFPLYSVRAVRTVGVFEESLFFGFDDLEYGLRLRAAGFAVCVHGALWRRERELAGRLDHVGTPSPWLDEPSWRRYYSLRNLIYILRKQGHHRGAVRLVLRSLGKPVINAPRHPVLAARHLALNTRAIIDAYRGRLGLTVSPLSKPAPASTPPAPNPSV